jgi:type IV secretory pathway VirB10-like protein
MMSRLALLLVLPLALALATTANASPKSEAKQHIKKAMKLHGDGKLREALDELTLGYALDPQADVLYAIGQVHVQLGDCAQAISFYERFLSSKPAPKANAQAAAREAIKVCKTNPPKPPEPKASASPEVKSEPPPPEAKAEAQPEPPPETKPDTKPETKIEAKAEPKPEPVKSDEPVFKKHSKRTGAVSTGAGPQENERPEGGATPFYKDVIGDVLVGGGVVAGVLSFMFYRQMQSKLDDSDNAASYQDHVEARDSARSKRNLAIGFGAGAVVLVGAGVARYILRDDGGSDGGVAIAPTTDGGFVTYLGRF